MKKKNDIKLDFEIDNGLIKDYLTTLILTITNPITILFFTAIFAALGLSNTINGFNSLYQLLIGIFVGSSIWWLFLSGLTEKLKSSLNKNILKKIDLLSGILILFFGLLILINLIKKNIK